MCDKINRVIIPIPLGEHKVEVHHAEDWLVLKVAALQQLHLGDGDAGNLQLCVWAEASQPAYVREVQR